MLVTITPSEMKRVERACMEATGVSGMALMERAAAHVAQAAARLSRGREGVTLCLCGTGNNGGDGLSAMRLLAAGDPCFQGVCWLLEGTLSPDAARQLERLQGEQPRVSVTVLTGDAPPPAPQKVACVVDGLFGTGLSRPPEGMAAQLCGLANRLWAQGVPVLAVDIPSGLDGAAGRATGAHVRATETVTFHRPKPGLYLGQGLDAAGRVTVGDIGLPREWDDAAGYAVLEPGDLPKLLPPRRRLSHKGSYGRVLLWAGKRGMAGAAAIAALAALRTGAGLVTVACEDGIVDTIQALCPCATCMPLPTGNPEAAWALLREGCEKADAIGVGCGLGQEADAFDIFKRLLGYLSARAGTQPLTAVLDADGLNLLSRLKGKELLAAKPGLNRAVLTPHPAEAGRLLGQPVSGVLDDPPAAALALRERYGAAVVLKGAASALVASEGVALNALGTPAMAKGGSGDALTGALTALLAGRAAGAYGMNTLQVLQAACGLHGLAGCEAEKRYGERGALVTDLCQWLGKTVW